MMNGGALTELPPSRVRHPADRSLLSDVVCSNLHFIPPSGILLISDPSPHGMILLLLLLHATRNQWRARRSIDTFLGVAMTTTNKPPVSLSLLPFYVGTTDPSISAAAPSTTTAAATTTTS